MNMGTCEGGNAYEFRAVNRRMVEVSLGGSKTKITNRGFSIGDSKIGRHVLRGRRGVSRDGAALGMDCLADNP